jgi:hypothetical protein
MKYKFDIKDMLPIGVTIVVVGLVLAFGLQITGDIQDDMTASSAEYNATADTIDGVGKLSEKLPLIATVVVAVIIIGILVTYFARR